MASLKNLPGKIFSENFEIQKHMMKFHVLLNSLSLPFSYSMRCMELVMSWEEKVKEVQTEI